MQANNKRIPIIIGTAAASAVCFLLRSWQLNFGRPIPHGLAASWILCIFCALLVLALVLYARRLPKQEEYVEAFSSGLPELLISAGSSVLILFSGILQLREPLDGFEKIIPFFCIVSALCMTAIAVLRYRGTVPSVALHVIPCLYLVVRLILNFKRWSVDPAVLDYCFELFASITAMCAIYQLGLFCYNKGHRRSASFWCLSGVIFSAVSLAGGNAEAVLLYAGICLWCGINAWQLLED